MLSVKGISKSFGDKKVLRDISIQLEAGKAKVLMGTNGSGKTTLFNIITGYLEANQGIVQLYNNSIDKMKPFERNAKGIGRTFQDLRLIGELSVLDNVILAFKDQSGEKWWKSLFYSRGLKKEQEENGIKAMEILATCFIKDVAYSKAAEISYGQQKLLTLACCIANDPKIILLDEPIAGVNPIYREKLESLIQNLKKEKALLIIEHNTDFVEAVADEILFLNEGKLTRFTDLATMRNDEKVQEAYI